MTFAKFFFILLLFINSKLFSQDTFPTIKGDVTISVKHGTFDCSLILENIPSISNYLIRLNSGMNILNFKNVESGELLGYEKSFKDTMASGESNAYYFIRNSTDTKLLMPHSFEIRYTGKYPIANDTFKNFEVDDWKGNIAFNGYSLRADGYQSCWYPILYDVENDKVYNKVKYDLSIHCADCKVIYFNGMSPVNDTFAHVKNEIPVDLSIYSGNFKTYKVGKSFFLNPDISKTQIIEFGNVVDRFEKFYENKLSIPYTSTINFIQTTPISKYNSWLFVSFPSIFKISWTGMKDFFDINNRDLFKSFIAHELGHYYFGNYRAFNSELGDIITEGFTEYISWKAFKSVSNDSIYNNKIKEKISGLKDFKPVPFSKIRSNLDYKRRELYVYSFTPIILYAIEKEIGEESMWSWIRLILQSPSQFTNYKFLEDTLNRVMKDKSKLSFIKGQYFESNEALANALVRIRS